MASSRTAAGSGGFCRRRDTRRTSRSHRLCTPRPLPPLGMAGLPTLTPPRGVPALPRGDGRDRPLPHPAAGFPGHSSSAACCRSTRWRVSPLLAMPPGWGAGPGGVDGGAGVPLRSRGRGQDSEASRAPSIRSCLDAGEVVRRALAGGPPPYDAPRIATAFALPPRGRPPQGHGPLPGGPGRFA